MQSEALRYKKSFEHSPKPSKHPKHTVFNDSNVRKSHFQNIGRLAPHDADPHIGQI